jgi:methyl acetate hydrolase
MARSPSPRSGRLGGAQTTGFEPIDAAMRQAVEAGTVAGAVAVGASEDGVVYEGTFGNADVHAGTPMSSDTVFWLLSMTKAFTATACMQLVEQGRLHPDQEAGEILQQLRSPMILEGFDAQDRPRLRPATRPITVRHLLTHTSGYTYPIWSEALLRYQQVTGMPDIATCCNGAFEAPLEFEPGERWYYGTGIDWVGKLIEAVTDTSLEVYFRDHIFAPLGMHDSGFLMRSEQKRRLATCCRRQADGSLAPMHFQLPQRPEFFMGGGGAFSTPRDYMTFLRMLLNGGSLNGVEILRPQTVETMMANQIGDLNVQEMRTAQPALSNDCDQFPGQSHKWSFSFDVNLRPGPHGRSAGSNSWAGLLNCYFWLDPTKKVTGAFFTQILPFFDERVVALYGEFERGLYSGLGRA